MPRLLHHHDRLLARANRRHLPGLHHRSLPAHGRQGPSHRGLLFQEEVNDSLSKGEQGGNDGVLKGKGGNEMTAGGVADGIWDGVCCGHDMTAPKRKGIYSPSVGSCVFHASSTHLVFTPTVDLRNVLC